MNFYNGYKAMSTYKRHGEGESSASSSEKVVAVILLCQFNIPTLILSENECSSPRNCQPCQRMCGHKINPCKTKTI